MRSARERCPTPGTTVLGLRTRSGTSRARWAGSISRISRRSGSATSSSWRVVRPAGRPGGRRPPRGAVEGQGHDDGPLGAHGNRHAGGDADLSAWLSCVDHRGVRAPHGAGCAGEQAGVRHRDDQELGEEHHEAGKWIVYTSADSVFQIAAHGETIPLEELYEASGVARDILAGPHAVGRVIARPFKDELATTPARRIATTGRSSPSSRTT